MTIIVFKEALPYRLDDLKVKFKVNNDDHMNKILTNLKKVGVLRVNQSYEDLDFLKEEINYEVKNDQELYFFKYVGAVQIESVYCLLIYPKYIPKKQIEEDLKSNNYKKFKTIIEVIEKYKNKLVQNISSTGDIKNDYSDKLGVKLSILQDFYEYGLYQKNKENIVLNGDGRILWNQTVNSRDAFIINNIPYYLDFYTSEVLNDEKNIVQIIHRIIITEICSELGLLLDILEYEKVDLTDIRLGDVGDKEELLNILEKEINGQFITKYQNIIKGLIAYIIDSSNKDQYSISIVGTRAFNLVWEDVCSVVFGNDLDKSFIDLGLKINGDANMTVKEYIEKPTWINNRDNTSFVQGTSLLLDVLTIKDNKMNIYDAKYYNTQFHTNHITGQPGINDITKQYLYELALSDIIHKNNLKVFNYFVMPKDDLGYQEKMAGYVKLTMLEKLGLEPIGIIYSDSQMMFDKYL